MSISPFRHRSIGPQRLLVFSHNRHSHSTAPLSNLRRNHTTDNPRRYIHTGAGVVALSANHVQARFIECLIRAGKDAQCKRERYSISQRHVADTDSKSASTRCPWIPSTVRAFSTKASPQAPVPAVAYNVTREELNGLVDSYGTSFDDAGINAVGPSAPSQMKPPRSLPIPPHQKVADKTKRTSQRASDRLEALLKYEETPHETLMDIYEKIPAPKTQHLSVAVLKTLIWRLMFVPHKSEASMLRFFVVMEDLKASGIPPDQKLWTSAIAFAGRCVKRITSDHMESALNLWKEMESKAGIRGNSVTFNVLFDIAAKAGKFVLAEMLLQEMQDRGLQMDRYSRVGQIYYNGRKKDSKGVRQAYRKLVSAGEIVDSSVIGCVIKALLLCSEPVAAEQVFERSKRLHARKTGSKPAIPPMEWRDRKQLFKAFDRQAKLTRQRGASPQDVQFEAPVAPGAQTYKSLVHFYAVVSGDFLRVSELVDEMDFYSIPLQGKIFLDVFKGFNIHGGIRYSDWSVDNLESVFEAFLEALDAKEEHVYTSLPAVQICLRAFEKCSTPGRTGEVYGELDKRWSGSEAEKKQALEILESLELDHAT